MLVCVCFAPVPVPVPVPVTPRRKACKDSLFYTKYERFARHSKYEINEIKYRKLASYELERALSSGVWSCCSWSLVEVPTFWMTV